MPGGVEAARNLGRLDAELGRAGAACLVQKVWGAEQGCRTLAVGMEAPAFAAFLTGPAEEDGRKQGWSDGAWLQLSC